MSGETKYCYLIDRIRVKKDLSYGLINKVFLKLSDAKLEVEMLIRINKWENWRIEDYIEKGYSNIDNFYFDKDICFNLMIIQKTLIEERPIVKEVIPVIKKEVIPVKQFELGL